MAMKGELHLEGEEFMVWLSNKLNDSDDRWSGRKAATILNQEIVTKLLTCFQMFSLQIKLNILLAIPHLSFHQANTVSPLCHNFMTVILCITNYVFQVEF